MENLATESFSYSWLTQKPPPPPPSDNLRQIEYDDDDFRFDVVTPPTSHLVNADEIFSEGQIMAVYANAADRSRTAEVAMKTSTSTSVPFLAADRKYRYYILGKWRRCSKKMLLKCLALVSRRRKSSSRVDDLERKVLEVGSFGNSRSVEASPRHSGISSAVDNLGYGFEFGLKIDHQNWRSITTIENPSRYVCCDIADENSIHEAILYCKRSILG